MVTTCRRTIEEIAESLKRIETSLAAQTQSHSTAPSSTEKDRQQRLVLSIEALRRWLPAPAEPDAKKALARFKQESVDLMHLVDQLLKPPARYRAAIKDWRRVKRALPRA